MILDLVRDALADTGLNLVAGASVADFDTRAPVGLKTGDLFPAARGVVVVASSGRQLWERLSAREASRDVPWGGEHPLDDYVEEALARSDAALVREGVGFRRLLPTFRFTPRISFVALGEIAQLGGPGPFGMLIHPEHGPWWALRGAYLVDCDVPLSPPLAHPCAGCPAPCVGGPAISVPPGEGTLAMRRRCVLGGTSRYEEEQIAYHYDRERTQARLKQSKLP